MTSYKGLLNKIEAFCSAHFQIEKYAGEFKEQMPNFATKDEKYPIVYVVPQSDTSDLNTNQFTVDIYCVDVIQKDRANINNIVSDCNLIVNDLYLYFLDGNDLSIDVVGASSGDAVNNFDLDYTAGWVKTITFEVSQYSVCAIPMSPINPNPPQECNPATYNLKDTLDKILASGTINSGETSDIVVGDSTVENSDSSFTDSITAEGTLVLNDITVSVNNSLNQLVNQEVKPSAIDITVNAPDSSYSVTDSLGTTLHSGNIPSDNSQTITVADSTVENSDASYSETILAEGSLVLPDITINVQNTLGTTVNSTTSPSVQDVILNAPDATVNIKKTGDGTIASISAPSGATTNYSVADNAITVNSGNGFTIDATDPLDIIIKDSNGSTLTPNSVTPNQGQHKVDIVLPVVASIDSDAKAFLTAASITDATITSAIDTFVTGLKSNGLWNKFYAIYPFVGGSAFAHKWNLKDPRDLDAAFRLTFFGGLTHNANGITGNGTTGYADTYFNPVSVAVNRENFGFTIYSRSSSWSGYAMGVTDGASYSLFLRSGTTQYYGVFDDGSAFGTLASGNKTLTTQRSSNTQQTLYRDGTSALSLNTITTKANPNYSFTLFCRNGAGGIQNFSAINTSMHAFHTVLTPTEVSTFNTLVVALQTTLSRNV